MSAIAVLGAGAFGTALALALSRDGTPVTLWCRDPSVAEKMAATRRTGPRLPGFDLPPSLSVSADLASVTAETVLLAVPMQELRKFLAASPVPGGRRLVACCKGIDRETGRGPFATIRETCPDATPALLTGPSFAIDIARGLPTALVLAADSDDVALGLQQELSRPHLRLYRSTDHIGAELGGALKNVIALAAGMTIGAGLGDSARASVIARGFAEMSRFATAKNALLETLHGLSGLGDLVLTCTSEKSRNLRAGMAFGRGERPEAGATIEGIATAAAVAAEAARLDLDLPLTHAVAEVAAGRWDVRRAVETLLARPVRKE